MRNLWKLLGDLDVYSSFFFAFYLLSTSIIRFYYIHIEKKVLKLTKFNFQIQFWGTHSKMSSTVPYKIERRRFAMCFPPCKAMSKYYIKMLKCDLNGAVLHLIFYLIFQKNIFKFNLNLNFDTFIYTKALYDFVSSIPTVYGYVAQFPFSPHNVTIYVWTCILLRKTSRVHALLIITFYLFGTYRNFSI